MKRPEADLQTDDNLPNNDWRDEETIDDKYEEHRSEFLKVLEEFENVWYGHLGRITAARSTD